MTAPLPGAPVRKGKPQLRTRPSLLDYLQDRLGVAKGTSREREFYCPFCIDRVGDESSKRKLSVNMFEGKVWCFRCEYGTNSLERFFRDLNGGSLKMEELMLLRGETKPPARDLAEAVADILAGEAGPGKYFKAVPLPKESVPLNKAKRDSIVYRRAFTYLEGRGYTGDALENLIERFQIGYCPSGDYGGRLVFPVFQQGAQVYFTTRYCGNHPAKSKNPPNVPGWYQRDLCLLNYDAVVGQPVVALAEGPFSVAAFEYAVGSMGKHVSPAQVSLLAALVPYGLQELVIAFDADAGKAIDKMYAVLSDRVPKVTVLPLDHGDPDDRRDELAELLAKRGVRSFADRVRSRFRGSK